MKIAFIAQPIDPVIPPHQNSIGIWTYEVGRRLAESNEILVYHKPQGFKGKKKTRIDGVRFNTVPLRFDLRFLRYLKIFSERFNFGRPLFAGSLYYLGYILKIAFNLKKEDCDIVHIHNFSQFVPIIRAINPKIKIVLHMHCEWLTQLDRNLIKRRVKYADLIVSCSRYITQKTQQAFPEIKHRCHTIYNGIDLKEFFPKDKTNQAESLDPIKILYVGRISPEKGVHILLDAFRKVQAGHSDVELHLVGPPVPAPREYIIDISNDPKVVELAPYFSREYISLLKGKIDPEYIDRVKFYKHIPYANLINLYHRADLFVFPSAWEEPFGMPIVEAMACGLPVVATRGGGIPEIVEDRRNGFLVERGDADALAKAIILLIQDQRLRESFAAEGKKMVQERLTWDRISKDLESAYRSI